MSRSALIVKRSRSRNGRGRREPTRDHVVEAVAVGANRQEIPGSKRSRSRELSRDPVVEAVAVGAARQEIPW